MRHDPHMRCISLIANNPEIKDYIMTVAEATNTHVVYNDSVAELDDLDFIDRYSAHDNNYNPDQYRYRYGSLWARREQHLSAFWQYLEIDLSEEVDGRSVIPIIFCHDTVSDDRFD